MIKNESIRVMLVNKRDSSLKALDYSKKDVEKLNRQIEALRRELEDYENELNLVIEDIKMHEDIVTEIDELLKEES